MEITANISLKNGRHIGDRNLSKITARSIKPTSSFCERGEPIRDYYCSYVARKEKDGYIFRERRFDTGISGHYPSLRSLILNTIINFCEIKVHIDI